MRPLWHTRKSIHVSGLWQFITCLIQRPLLDLVSCSSAKKLPFRADLLMPVRSCFQVCQITSKTDWDSASRTVMMAHNSWMGRLDCLTGKKKKNNQKHSAAFDRKHLWQKAWKDPPLNWQEWTLKIGCLLWLLFVFDEPFLNQRVFTVWIKLLCSSLAFACDPAAWLLCMEQWVQAFRSTLSASVWGCIVILNSEHGITLFFHSPVTVCSCAQGKPVSSNACWMFTKSSERTTRPTYWMICTSQTTASGSRGSSKFTNTHS